ncbi:MAG: hypothetical protein FWH34_02675 [Desulfovibrionaceae bacterium]|nr:hypothetical protein [Desulfovibrionaceae bacterium]
MSQKPRPLDREGFLKRVVMQQVELDADSIYGMTGKRTAHAVKISKNSVERYSGALPDTSKGGTRRD